LPRLCSVLPARALHSTPSYDCHSIREELRLASTHVLLVLVSVQQLLLSTTHVHGHEREREVRCVWKVRSRPPLRRRDCKLVLRL
ncbi:unnamed protein product, partial [Pylaiella littoralis]